MTGSETATVATPRLRGVSGTTLAVAGLVVVSTLVRFAVARAFTTPWIAPDEMVYGMVGEALWSDGTLSLRGLPAPYYSLLTPALVGAPLAFLDLVDGIRWAQLVQALAMSLAAVPVYVWTRRLAPARWALGAAAVVLAAPALHYAGFLMTEPLTLVVVAVALLMLARALEEPSHWRYGVFVAWATAAAAVRLQALVLLPAFLLAAGLDALAARDRTRLRPLLGLAGIAAIAVAVVAGVVAATGGDLSMHSLLGAYTPVGESPPTSASGLPEIVWHAFDVALLGLCVPVLALAALTARVLGQKDRDPRLRAFVVTTIAYTSLLVVQVGLFSAGYVGHVAERYLITALPLLAVGLCAWGARRGPRELPVVLPTLGVLLVLAAVVPLDELVAPGTLVNTLTPAPLAALAGESAQRVALVGAVLAAGALTLLLPRRHVWIAAAAVGVGLALVSVDTARRIVDASAHEQRVTMGSGAPGWLDDAGLDGATMLVTGDRPWTAVARTLFWNRAVDEVVRVAPATIPFPPATPAVTIADDGTLVTADGSHLALPVVVTPETLVLAGDRLAERPAGDSEVPGLVAWRPREPVRAELRKEGFLPNGDITGEAHVTVYACRPGTLDVTILGKSGDPIHALVDGIEVATLETPAGESATHRVPAPPYADGTRPCSFTLETAGYAGSTAIVFSPETGRPAR